LFILAFALLYALIGFIDDYEKVKKKQNLGLKAWHKFAFQLIIAAAFIFLMHHQGRLSTLLFIPFVNIYFEIPTVLYYIFAAFVIVGTVNSVNITDGVDGLATGVTIPVAVALVFIAFLANDISVGIFAAALTGGLVGFLIFNFHPAKVIMGDTGSLFLGGAVCAIAFALDIPLLLITLGIVYFIETLSDIIQIGYFKLTKGKRVFKMAPIHHHFEMIGWSEYKVFTVFTAISAIFALISYFGVVNRVW
jgi:phospho-N-acetylmuramoyl-pentapeptide-transferase